VRIAAVRVCLHFPELIAGGDPALARRCECRKPKPGLLDGIVSELGLSRQHSWMVGDTLADAGAARAAGLRLGLLMQTTRCELCPFVDATPMGVHADARAPRLDELARAIVALDAG
jgi:D-glycero-D-manno-heptose 1,7-bisphosphate phosphatase